MYSATSWKDFAVLDTGDGEKLERWGDIILRRHDPQTLSLIHISEPTRR